MMRNDSLLWRFRGVAFGLLLGFLLPVAWAETGVSSQENQPCQACHDGGKKIELPDLAFDAEPGSLRPLTAITPTRYGQGVHAAMGCRQCHTRITSLQPPHQSGKPEKIDCAGCHEKLAAMRQGEPLTPGLEKVAQNTQAYRRSFHVRPNPDDPRIPNATCHQCHDSHFFDIPADKSSPAYTAWRMTIPELCGQCHDHALEKYRASVHGIQLLEKGNSQSATCADCHTTHEITGAFLTPFRLLSPEKCGSCHPRNLRTYRDTYHGQVTKLGYPHTAKCFDCHESHKTLHIKDALSTVHPDNRLKSCRKCHDGERRPLATAGFASFSPHAHAGDFERYPQVWIASRFMAGLLLTVFGFFWLHSGLWYYRERQERKTRPAAQPRVALRSLGLETAAQVRRFPLLWRVGHLLFALVVMTLVLTGMSVLHADSAWAPVVARLLGGATSMGIIHRVAATLLMGIFVLHLLYLLQRLLRDGRFRWLGPDSLLPNWKDVTDCRDMFRWFLGRGPKPLFERWTYYEKFDYWAVFWGMAVIGGSGLLLAFPHIAGQYLEGWVFNVALLVHGEEAFLAAVFLFTVHFFNNHFRPDKLPPPDIVMFTGSQTLEEFQRDHPAYYQRLLANGELNRHLVPPPSAAMTLGSRVLGLLLIGVGLSLLGLVVHGFLGRL